jgi:hypothetical protein
MDGLDKAADPIDHSANMQAKMEQAQVDSIRREAQKPIPTSKVCLYCAEPTEAGARWCNGFCRDRWQAGRR